MSPRLPRVAAGAILLLALAAPATADELWLRADVVHTGDGRRIEEGIVHVRDGRIVAVGADLAIPAGAALVELPGAEITPGLVDANAKLEPEDLLRPLRRDPAAVVRGLFGHPAEEPPHFHDLTGCPSFAAHEEGQVCPHCGGEGAAPTPPEGHGEVSGVAGPSAISEQSSEVVPHTAWIEAIDLGSPDLDRLLREGVTTVLAAPDPSAVIGARSAVVRTAGEDRVLLREGSVRAVIGSDPYRFGTFNRTPNRGSVTHFSRRPQSRMGVGWIFRKAFHDALLRAAGGEPSGADTASPEASAVVLGLLEGRVPLWVQARTASDIESALRLCGEFGVPFTLVDPVEAYRCLDLLAVARVPVVFGPIYDDPSGLSARSSETRRARLHTLSDLVAAGVPLCLSAQDLREEDGLARQAMLAIRTGIAPERALELVTLSPARIIGIDGEVGSLEAGKRADLVVWSGPPFAATSAVRRVYVDGRLAFERKG
jgi:imidazolonepropionase-like amidohydrolase